MPTVAQENGAENVLLPLVILTTNMVAVLAVELLATMIVTVREIVVMLVQSAAEVRVMKSTGNAKTFLVPYGTDGKYLSQNPGACPKNARAPHVLGGRLSVFFAWR